MANPSSSDIGLIGLAVMGQNLVLNMVDHGFTVSVFNRTYATTEQFVTKSATPKVQGFDNLKDFVLSLKRPRKLMLMVKAGKPVDDMISQFEPFLEKGDIIIDGGNSNFNDTNRRTKEYEEKGFLYIGTGVSGGEEGARYGPSIMPGGSKDAWPEVKTILQAISAKVEDGSPCCDWVGENGAGHYVKMVHNGIEYGDMQLITEVYHLMSSLLHMSADEISLVFDEWNRGKLDSYLIEITKNILKVKDTDGQPLVEKILDTAGQKGTGKWTAISSLDLGINVSLIAESVFQRCISAMKDERVNASNHLEFKNDGKMSITDRLAFINDLRDALYASKIISYTQGFMLMKAAAKEYSWKLNNGGIALMWRGGCIIRSVFLGEIKKAFDKNPDLESLLMDSFFQKEVMSAQEPWRQVVTKSIEHGIPVPGLSSALAFFDSYRSAVLPANLLQAQRDYFGAHTYERVDKPRGEFFHTEWTNEAKK